MKAKDYMWLIKLSDIEQAGHEDVIKSIGAEMFYQWLKHHDKKPVSYMVHLMRFLRDEHFQGYLVAKAFIEKKYTECFPGIEATTSESVLRQLEKFSQSDEKRDAYRKGDSE